MTATLATHGAGERVVTAAGLNMPVRALGVAGLIVLAAMAAWIAWRLPVFSQIDELAHMDYALKLARHGAAVATQPIEADLMALALARLGDAHQMYFGVPPTEEVRASMAGLNSYEAFQPPLFYLLAAVAIRGAAGLGAGLEAQVRTVRMLNVALAVVGRGLLLLALLRLGKPLALAALPALVLLVPVDLLRVSNDTLLMALAAGSFAVLLGGLRGVDGLGRGRSLAIGLLLLAALATKNTAAIYLLPALVIVAGALRRELRPGGAGWALMLLPVLLTGGALAVRNVARTGSLAGAPHLADGMFPAATGFRLAEALPLLDDWHYGHLVFLTQETLLGGMRGADLAPLLPWFVTLIIAAGAGALVLLMSGEWRARLGAAVGCGTEGARTLARLAGGSLAAFYAALLIGTLLTMVVGQAFFFTSRMLAPLELPLLASTAVGAWAVLGGAGRLRAALRPALWLGSAAMCFWITSPYLYWG